MEYKTGIDNLKLPVIGLGTWGIGGFMTANTMNDLSSISSIRNAFDMGYTHIDTAELYGAGHTEEIIGQAMDGYKREGFIVTSKVSKAHFSYEDTISACQNSLKRLKTDYIDIYLIHEPNKDIPIQETMRAMEFLVENKLIRHIGVSNFSVAEIQEAQKHCRFPISVNQIPYSLATRNSDHLGPCRNMESKIIPYCQENNILIMAYRPIERGFLLEENVLIQKLCKKYQKTPAQIAINWLLSKKNIVTIPKSINQEHLEENLGSIGWTMTSEDLLSLDCTSFSGYN